MVANITQKAARGVAVLAVALGAGQFMQSTAKPAAKPQTAEAALSVHPTHVEQVAAGSEAVAQTAQAAPAPAKLPPMPALAPAPAATLAQAAPAPAQTAPLPDATPSEPKLAADPCPTSLDLSLSENAMIGITLVAACHPNERVVLKHAGLAVTAKTTVTGAIFADLPALERAAEVEVLFADGTSLTSSIDVPEVSKLNRFGVQWQAQDSFQLHGFENSAGFGDPGDVNASNPNRPAAGVPAISGFVSVLGDSTTETPLLAEVYTYPAKPSTKAEIVVEAAVTDTTCGREMLGETLLSLGGKVTKSDLTVSMPECDAIGDYLVLNNLVPDMNIASSE